MTIDKLIKYCLQYLELDTETNVMNTSVDELAENDTFIEYINNIENSLLMGLTRYASSNVLPVEIYEFVDGEYTAVLASGKRPLANKIKEVFAINSNGDLISNIEYYVIGNTVRIKKPKKDYKYNVVYHPAIHDFDYYIDKFDYASNIYDIELNDLGVTDEMAINLKYFVYSDLKLEENPNVANINKNYFETYLASLERNQVVFNQTELVNRTNFDVYGDESVTFSKEWRDVYGD